MLDQPVPWIKSQNLQIILFNQAWSGLNNSQTNSKKSQDHQNLSYLTWTHLTKYFDRIWSNLTLVDQNLRKNNRKSDRLHIGLD